MDVKYALGQIEDHNCCVNGNFPLQSKTMIGSLLRNGAVFPINGLLRDELLNETLFPSLNHARATLAAWRKDYNTERPHSRLGWQAPAEIIACLKS